MTTRQFLLRYALPSAGVGLVGFLVIGEIMELLITDTVTWALVVLPISVLWASFVGRVTVAIYHANEIVNPILRRAANGRRQYEGSCRQKLSD